VISPITPSWDNNAMHRVTLRDSNTSTEVNVTPTAITLILRGEGGANHRRSTIENRMVGITHANPGFQFLLRRVLIWAVEDHRLIRFLAVRKGG
jgi:hypothetical protein